MPGRSGGDYRYGFNGKEKDKDGEIGSLTHYDYGFRIYNPGIGRFLSVDPLGHKMPTWSPYSYCFDNPVRFVDQNGEIPILPLLKAGANAAADWFMQTAMNYYFNPNTAGDWGASSSDVNGWQIARSGLEGLIPWRTPGGRLGRAAVSATGDVLVNWAHNRSNYSTEKAVEDFAVGFIGDLAGGGLGELIAKYGSKSIARGLSRMGFDYGDVNRMLGGGVRQINKTINGVTATRKMVGWAEGKVAVIGRNMKRVRKFAKGVNGITWGGWDDNLSPNQNLANNKKWIQGLKDKGYTIYDVGLDPEYTSKGDFSKGRFYQMETKEIFGD